ncbi:hypothetical protein GALMADRAFT_137432 [Galerina marginata CBS 339.88]|uniref:G-protein coupled receptors family 1 profile domain-containing protein n=1 Tax=Galerina marginata (strain CBS 339.88) TaxID=685588 RepID=A0A067TKY8_GALM3|nr:hypothetical protein GALMADRAFT_137432 [Galerina marginata CBS 339.88]
MTSNINSFVAVAFASLETVITSNQHEGRSFILWEAWTGLIGCLLPEGILQIRIFALYRENTMVIRVMFTTFIICSTISAWVIGSGLSTIIDTALPITITGGKFCYASAPGHAYLFWIPILFFETFLCTLAAIRTFQAYKTDGFPFNRFQRLLYILIRDSLLYFLTIGFMYLTCLAVWILEPNILLEAPAGFSLAISSIFGSRMILNLRDTDLERQVELSRVLASLEFE